MLPISVSRKLSNQNINHENLIIQLVSYSGDDSSIVSRLQSALSEIIAGDEPSSDESSSDGIVDSLVSDVSSLASDLIDDVTSLAGDATSLAGGLVSDVTSLAGDLISDVTDAAGDLVSDAADAVGNVLQNSI